MDGSRPLAIITGASSGIGLHLALEAASQGYDLVLGADQPLSDTESMARSLGASVISVECDLATSRGVDALFEVTRGREVSALLANAGHGLGKGFLDQDFKDVQHVINTNITGTIDLIQRVARDMRQRGSGRILITGSIAGFMPGTFQAVYNGSKAFLDSFSYALRNELKDSGVTVTCLMPGVTDTEFFQRADLLDTKLAADNHKADPGEVARTGFAGMLRGDAAVVAGLGNKLRVALANLIPNTTLAEAHRKTAEPGSAHH